ncbi:MAG: hypothetical protein GWP17_06215, partial [Aquificales bacterium]|nr:hypothetical protein [Aquificales bacterium]
MKRFLLFSSLILLVVLLAACGGSDAEAPVEQPVQEAPVEQVQPTAEPTLPPPVVSAGGETAPEAQPEQPAAEPEVLGPVVPWPADAFGYGAQVHGNATVGNAADTMASMRHQLDLDWVKMQLKWPVIHPGEDADQWFFYDSVIEEANKNGVNLMV